MAFAFFARLSFFQILIDVGGDVDFKNVAHGARGQSFCRADGFLNLRIFNSINAGLSFKFDTQRLCPRLSKTH